MDVLIQWVSYLVTFILNMGQFMSCEADLLHFDSLLLEELK